MRNFLKNILLFSLILIVINSLLYFSYKRIYLDEYTKDPKGFNTYLFSDSHGLSLGSYIEGFGIYNFSAGSDSYTDMKRKLEYLIRHQSIDTVIIQLEGQVLSKFREEFNNDDRSLYYTSYNENFDEYNYLKEAYLKYYFILLNPKSQSVFNYYIKSNIYSLLGQEDADKQTEWHQLPNKIKEERAKERIHQFYSSGISQSLHKSFEEIIKISKEHRIELIGLKYPLPNEFTEVINNRSNSEIYKNYHQADSILYSYGLKVLNFENSFSGRSHLFKDEDHLSEEGGKYFADSLQSILNR